MLAPGVATYAAFGTVPPPARIPRLSDDPNAERFEPPAEWRTEWDSVLTRCGIAPKVTFDDIKWVRTRRFPADWTAGLNSRDGGGVLRALLGATLQADTAIVLQYELAFGSPELRQHEMVHIALGTLSWRDVRLPNGQVRREAQSESVIHPLNYFNNECARRWE